MRKTTRNNLATWAGLLTTIIQAAVLIDFDTINYRSVNDWMKILVVVAPAVGGYLSEIKTKQNPTQ